MHSEIMIKRLRRHHAVPEKTIEGLLPLIYSCCNLLLGSKAKPPDDPIETAFCIFSPL